MTLDVRDIKCLKYVDDCLSIEKVYFKESEKLNVDNTRYALSRAAKTQDQFRTVEFNAGRIGMQINN